jgi:hypothetical protein
LVKKFSSKSFHYGEINGILCRANAITAGGPQGAAISPILFSLLINDIPIIHKKNKDYSLLFADDLVFPHFFQKKRKCSGAY